MKTKKEIQEKLKQVQQELQDIKSNLKYSYSTIREGVKYYTGYIRALEYVIEKENKNEKTTDSIR